MKRAGTPDRRDRVRPADIPRGRQSLQLALVDIEIAEHDLIDYSPRPKPTADPSLVDRKVQLVRQDNAAFRSYAAVSNELENVDHVFRTSTAPSAVISVAPASSTLRQCKSVRIRCACLKRGFV